MEQRQQLVEQEQELIESKFVESFCLVHNSTMKFLQTDNKEYWICTECGFRKKLETIPEKVEIKTISMKDFYDKLKKTQDNG